MFNDIPKPNAPCKGCPDRHMGCHSTCNTYLNWDQNRQELLAIKEKEHKLNDAIVRLNYHGKNHAIKRRNIKK